MNVSEDQVRAATRIAAAVITADKVPPLRLAEPPGSLEPPHRTWQGWAGPLAAAAAVVIVVAGSQAAGSWFARSGNGQSGNPRAPVGSFTGVPPYYVAVENWKLAVVRATATGATLARITTHTPFVGVAGAADDRTFVLDAQRQAMGPTVQWPAQPAFYLLRLTASGAEKSFTRLPLPALPKGLAVTGLALSPDGSKLAVVADSERYPTGLMEVRVYTLATRTFRTWFTNASTSPVDPEGFTGSGVDGSQTISWAADARTVAFDWKNQSYVGVRLLDTTASGDNLITDSRLAVIEANFTSQGWGQSRSLLRSKDHISRCVTDSIISLDRSAIVCGYATTIVRSGAAQDTTTGFIRYSTRTGKPTHVDVFRFRGQAGGDVSLYWTDSAGKTSIGGVLTPRGIRVGVINGETFTPLPGITGLGAAAW
jgi:hypothetical protein